MTRQDPPERAGGAENHPSFAIRDADGSPPARKELQALLDKGFGRLYRDRAEAERELGVHVTLLRSGMWSRMGPVAR